MKKLLVIIAMAGVATLYTANAADAKDTFEKNCASCHGKDGKGQTTMGKKAGCKDYTDAKVQEALKDDKAFKAVKEGLKEGDKVLMKAFADKLSDEEIKGLVAYVRTFKK